MALTGHPGYGAAHNNLGNALAALGENAEAMAEYRHAIELDPGYAAARRNLERLEAVLKPKR